MNRYFPFKSVIFLGLILLMSAAPSVAEKPSAPIVPTLEDNNRSSSKIKSKDDQPVKPAEPPSLELIVPEDSKEVPRIQSDLPAVPEFSGKITK